MNFRIAIGKNSGTKFKEFPNKIEALKYLETLSSSFPYLYARLQTYDPEIKEWVEDEDEN